MTKPVPSPLTSAPWTLEKFTATDDYRWAYRHYPALGAPRARVVCLHGIQSHGGWYEHSCRRLAEAGFDVSFLDRRGSGLNVEARGDAPGFRRLLDDIAEFLRPLRGASGGRQPPGGSNQGADAPRSPHPALPVFLLAISWGGKLAVALQRRHPGLADGLALLCPGFCPRVGPSARERLAILWARLTAPGKLFTVPLSDPALFTAEPRRQQFIRDDPLSVRHASARFLVESARLDGYLRWAAPAVKVPVLLLLAGHDRIIDNAATRRFVGRFGTQDREVHEYPGAHHTLEFEPDPERFLADLLRWLDRHAGALPAGPAAGDTPATSGPTPRPPPGPAS